MFAFFRLRLRCSMPLVLVPSLVSCLYFCRRLAWQGIAVLLVLAGNPLGAAEAGKHRFDVYEYAVDGVSLLSTEVIEQAVMHYLGEQKSVEDVQNARKAIEEAYKAAGYLTALVTIPNQPTDTGVIELKVVEGQVERLRVKGAEYHLPSDIKARVDEFAEGKVPHFPTMQAQMAALNGNDLRVTPVLRAGTAPGTVEVDLEVEDSLPVHGSFDWNNRYSAHTSEQRMGLSLRYDNLWQAGHSLGLTAQLAPERPSDTRVLALNYSVPFDKNILSVYAVSSRSALASLPGASALGTLGDSDIFGVRWIKPLKNPGIEGFYHTLSLGVDWKDMRQSVTLAGGAVDTPVTYMPFSVSYSATRSGAAGASTTFDASAVFSVRGALPDDSERFAARRQGADASFFILRLGSSRLQPFGAGWMGYARVDAQLASQPLISNEQLVGAGAESVRGYLESERLGDSGVRSTLELRAPATNLGVAGIWLTPAVFFDIAQLYTQQTVYPQKEHRQLRGTGLSLRARGAYGLRLEADYAVALDDGDQTRSGDRRIHARLLWDF
jgi:hemolysin activation/secretion protein